MALSFEITNFTNEAFGPAQDTRTDVVREERDFVLEVLQKRARLYIDQILQGPIVGRVHKVLSVSQSQQELFVHGNPTHHQVLLHQHYVRPQLEDVIELLDSGKELGIDSFNVDDWLGKHEEEVLLGRLAHGSGLKVPVVNNPCRSEGLGIPMAPERAWLEKVVKDFVCTISTWDKMIVQYNHTILARPWDPPTREGRHTQHSDTSTLARSLRDKFP